MHSNISLLVFLTVYLLSFVKFSFANKEIQDLSPVCQIEYYHLKYVHTLRSPLNKEEKKKFYLSCGYKFPTHIPKTNILKIKEEMLNHFFRVENSDLNSNLNPVENGSPIKSTHKNNKQNENHSNNESNYDNDDYDINAATQVGRGFFSITNILLSFGILLFVGFSVLGLNSFVTTYIESKEQQEKILNIFEMVVLFFLVVAKWFPSSIASIVAFAACLCIPYCYYVSKKFKNQVFEFHSITRFCIMFWSLEAIYLGSSLIGFWSSTISIIYYMILIMEGKGSHKIQSESKNLQARGVLSDTLAAAQKSVFNLTQDTETASLKLGGSSILIFSLINLIGYYIPILRRLIEPFNIGVMFTSSILIIFSLIMIANFGYHKIDHTIIIASVFGILFFMLIAGKLLPGASIMSMLSGTGIVIHSIILYLRATSNVELLVRGAGFGIVLIISGTIVRLFPSFFFIV